MQHVPLPLDRPLPERLLGVWAHPDDEAYLSAGLMARVAQHGSVTVVTATSGEHGTGDPSLAGTAEFAHHRRGELRASLDVLGVSDVTILDAPDGGCERIDPQPMVAYLADVIRDRRPDAIVTFGSDGITGHPDHCAVSAWTTAAWRRTGKRAELLYATVTEDFNDRWAALHDRLGLFTDYGQTGRPPAVRRDRLALECVLGPGESHRKRAALACHASQTEELAGAVGESTFLHWWAVESFRHPTEVEAGRSPADVGSYLDESSLVGVVGHECRGR